MVCGPINTAQTEGLCWCKSYVGGRPWIHTSIYRLALPASPTSPMQINSRMEEWMFCIDHPCRMDK